MIYALMRRWDVEMIDIEAAFLNAELDEEMFVEWPDGVV